MGTGDLEGQALDPSIPLVRGLGELGVGDVEVLDDPPNIPLVGTGIG